MSLVAFLLAKDSIVLAGVMSAAMATGMIAARLFRTVHPRALSIIMTIARAGAVFAAYQNANAVAIMLATLAGSCSRRLFLDLKHQVGDIDPRHLVAHGAYNSLGFGVGAAIAGFLLPFETVAQLAALAVAVAAVVAYPDADEHDVEEATGLTRRDLAATVVFSFAATPSSNAIAPALLIGIVGSQVAGLSCLMYTIGSVLSSQVAGLLLRHRKPVALSTALSAITFAVMLLAPVAAVIYLARFVAGAVLYAGQGIMEMRTHREGDGKGLEQLWTLLSAAGVVANLTVPFVVEQTSLWAAPLWTLLGAVIIANLRHVPGLRADPRR